MGTTVDPGVAGGEAGAVVAAFIRAIEQRDVDAAMTYAADEMVFENVPLDPPASPAVGKEAVRASLARLIDIATEVDWAITRQVAVRDLVMNERVDRFVFRDGAELSCPVVGVWEVRDGRIFLWRDYFDLDTVTTQLGTGWDTFVQAQARQ